MKSIKTLHFDNCSAFKFSCEKIPYYHFIFKGEFYRYIRKRSRNKYFDNGVSISEYFIKKAYKQYNFGKLFTVFRQALMIIVHTFEDVKKKDLDNINYKPIVDAIKKTRIIPDDFYEHLSFMTIGKLHYDNISCDTIETLEQIEVYVVPTIYAPQFITAKFFDLYDVEHVILKEQIVTNQVINDEMNKEKEHERRMKEDKEYAEEYRSFWGVSHL